MRGRWPGPAGNTNNVLESGETVQVDPSWTNTLLAPASLTGTGTSFTGPGGASCKIGDSSADYGNVAAEATNDCNDATGRLLPRDGVGPEAGPALGRDIQRDGEPGRRDEGVVHPHRRKNPDGLPTDDPFYALIENLFRKKGVTGGCGLGNYCPLNSVTRGQMAVFLLKGRFGSAFVPPPATGTGSRRHGRTASHAAWIESLAGFKVTGGCGNRRICSRTTP